MLNVFLDANVFVSAWALDVVMCLSDGGLVYPLWSEAVLSEYVRAMDGLGRGGIARRTRTVLERSYPYSLVEGWEGRVGCVDLPDPDDRHVVAAALEGECDAIVTYNLRDFPAERLATLGLRAVSPDDLVMELVGERPFAVLCVVQGLVASKRRPPRTYDQEIEGLRRCGMRRFADWLDS